MNGLERRVMRLEGVRRVRRFWRFSDPELDALMRAELRAWMAERPDACADDVRGEVLAFLAAGYDGDTA